VEVGLILTAEQKKVENYKNLNNIKEKNSFAQMQKFYSAIERARSK